MTVTVSGACGTISAVSGSIPEGSNFAITFVPSASLLGTTGFTATANYSLGGNQIANNTVNFNGSQVFNYAFGQTGSGAVSLAITAYSNGTANSSVCFQTFNEPITITGVAPTVCVTPLPLLSLGDSILVTGGFSSPASSQTFTATLYVNSCPSNQACTIAQVSSTQYTFSCAAQQFMLIGSVQVTVVVTEGGAGGLSGSASTSGLVVGLGNLLPGLL